MNFPKTDFGVTVTIYIISIRYEVVDSGSMVLLINTIRPYILLENLFGISLIF